MTFFTFYVQVTYNFFTRGETNENESTEQLCFMLHPGQSKGVLLEINSIQQLSHANYLHGWTSTGLTTSNLHTMLCTS